MTLSSSPICEKQVKYINRCVDKSQWTWPEETNWIKWSLDQLIVSTKLHIAWNRRYLHGLETFSIWSLQPSTPSYTVLSHKISETKIWDLMNILARKELCKLNDFASWKKKYAIYCLNQHKKVVQNKYIVTTLAAYCSSHYLSILNDIFLLKY